MTKEQEKAWIGALLEQRRGYEIRVVKANEDEDAVALADAEARIAHVDSELKRLGASAKKPSERAAKRQRK